MGQLYFGHLTCTRLVSAVRQREVLKKEDSKKQAGRYQISELRTLSALSPCLTGFRENKEQAVDWIKSSDRSELCPLEIITLFIIYTVAIYTPYWTHAVCLATIIVTNSYLFLISTEKKKLSTPEWHQHSLASLTSLSSETSFTA